MELLSSASWCLLLSRVCDVKFFLIIISLFEAILFFNLFFTKIWKIFFFASLQVGDDFMVYLLKNTSIFLPAPQRKHHQVGGPPINRRCFDMLKSSSEFDCQHRSLHDRGNKKCLSTYCDFSEHTICSQRCKPRHLTDHNSLQFGFQLQMLLTNNQRLFFAMQWNVNQNIS